MANSKQQWKATVTYLIDGSVHEKTFAGHRISVQVFDGHIPRRVLIHVRNENGEATESFQCDYQSVHKKLELDAN